LSLKTDYKDAVFTGQRAYALGNIYEDTYSITDVTEYEQVGSKFGAADINATNAEVNRLGNLVTVYLPLAGWSSTAPYTQRVAVAGMKSTDVVKVFPYTPKDLTVNNIKLRRKFTAMITDFESEDGYAVFYCAEKKPTEGFTLAFRRCKRNIEEADQNGERSYSSRRRRRDWIG